jgi:NTP pyrophosphatase (non-canonical NTP hydrolase)
MEASERQTDSRYLDHLQDRALQVKDLYDELNQIQRGRTWTREEFMLGFTGDVGDLAKLVMAQEGAREMPGGREALGHELADCLWSVLVLASAYGIDLAAQFHHTMNELSTAIRSQLDGA